MNTVTVFTNLACNQRCGFCTFRRSEDEPSFTARARVEGEIARAAAAGARTLVLTGGEPTLSAGLLRYIRVARELGLEAVVVETNGMLLASEKNAVALAKSGATRVRVALNAASPEESDALTSTPGGFELTLRGIRNAARAGLPVELSVAVTAQNLERLPALVDLVGRRLPGVHDLLLRVVTEAEASWVPTYRDAADAIVRLATRAREAGLTVRFDGRDAIPLCFFPERKRFPELFAGGPPREGQGFERIDACSDCAAKSRCPGVPQRYVALHGAAAAVPVPEREARFVAGLGRDRAAAVEAELVNDAFFALGGGGIERVLRVNFHCNQSCDFCFVDRTLPAEPVERLMAEIDRAAAEGVALLSLSGGEPTLHPRLPELIARARALGLRTQIQTNAVRCADPKVLGALTEAGLDAAFVSLHAGEAALSDALTSAPGTFERTVRGIDALLTAGVAVTLNCVITGTSFDALPDYARFVVARWGARVGVNLSFAHASTDLVPRETRIIPKLSAVRPFIATAIEIFRRAGITVLGFDGQCGMPLCVIGGDWLDVSELEPLPEPNPPRGFVKTEACSRCALTDRCVGLRQTYLMLYGSSELSPVLAR